MKIDRAYIITTSSLISKQYADICESSCKKVGIPSYKFAGIEGESCYNAWSNHGLDIKQGSMDHRKAQTHIDPAACCSVSHALIWKEISTQTSASIILEHDAIMLHNIDMDIPDGAIIVLGYKLIDPTRYDHLAAGPPTTFTSIYSHHGAHGYAITPNTARMLLEELKVEGGGGPVDNRFFLRDSRSFRTKVPLKIADPIAALGWIRETTIWESVSENTDSQTIYSFHSNLRK